MTDACKFIIICHMAKKKKKKSIIGKIIVRGLAILGTVAALFVILVFGLVSVISLGPSETAKGIFVNSVMGTSAAKFLARIYFSEDEIQKMISSEQEEASVKFDPNSLDLVKIRRGLSQPSMAEAFTIRMAMERAGCPLVLHSRTENLCQISTRIIIIR